MKRTTIAVSLLLLVGLAGCGKVQPDGTKVFGQTTVTTEYGVERRSERIEFPDRQKQFGVTLFDDGSRGADRVELPNGEIQSKVSWNKDGTLEWLEQADYPNGTHKGSIWFPDKTGSGYYSVDSSSYPERVSTYSSSSDIRKQMQSLKAAETKPSHLTFRGLHAGLSKKEVWAILKANVADADFLINPETDCDPRPIGSNGLVVCEGGPLTLVFSREDKLIRFHVSIYYDGDNPEGFFTALSKEMAADNGGEGTEESYRQLDPKYPERSFTWRTDQTVGEGCMDDPKGDCPSETIDYGIHYDIHYDNQRPYAADIWFTDNRYYKLSVWCPTCPV